ncbi:MAG: hypothetical protein MZV63_41225 [Marinilabiliales bacterium]|nr:hypothetical protein [Marinilabiliales bacterium]
MSSEPAELQLAAGGSHLSLLNIDERQDVASHAAGISGPGEMEKLARIIGPDCSCHT